MRRFLSDKYLQKWKISYLSKKCGQDKEGCEGHHHAHVEDGDPEEEGEVADDHKDERGNIDGENRVAVQPRHRDPHPRLPGFVTFLQQHQDLSDLRMAEEHIHRSFV